MRKILIKKSSVSLLVLFVVAGLFLQYQPANAFAFLAALPLMGQILGGLTQGIEGALDFFDTTVMHLLVWTAALSAFATVFMTFSAAFLDFTSGLPVKLDNPLVTAGWNLTSGLVNSIFILIFIAIVLAYIFNKANYELKKTLPRLIIIALLLNFSLLFVKIFTDFGWIAQNAIKSMISEQGGLASNAIEPLKIKLLAIHSKLYGQIMAYMFASFIPGWVWFKVVRMATVVLGEALFSSFSQAFLLIAFGFVSGLTFFVYGLLFLARTIVIYLLAITAPLAFAAYILPATQKYFQQWFRALLQWIFLGVIVFFFMGLGVKLFALLIDPTTVLAGFKGGYVQFIFLLVYLWVVLILAKKLLPAGMQAVWNAGEAVTRTGIMAAGAGGLVAAKALRTGAGAAKTG